MSEEIYGGMAVGRALKEEGVECIFGVHGYINLAIEEACRQGIKMYHFRHEQSAGFAADAYARCLRSPGVCFASASAGTANYPSSLLQARGALSPVVLLIGQHGTGMDGLNALQEGYGTELLKTSAKWTHRCIDWNMHSYWVRKALMDSVGYPPGPVVLEFPIDSLNRRGPDAQRKWISRSEVAEVPRSQGDPTRIEAAVRMLLEGKKPLLIAGDGVYWGDGMRELQELAELLRIPVQARRTARGAVPENHPLAYGSGFRRPLFSEADVICVIGLQATQLEEWFEPPDWSVTAKYIQIHERADEIWYGLPTEVAVAGTSKLVLRQMIECARGLLSALVDRKEWLTKLEQERRGYQLRQQKTLKRYDNSKLIHPHTLTAAIADVMDPTATVIYDSFTGSTYLTDKLEARFAGQILDSGFKVALGQGIGMSIGAQIARPGKQVLTLVGDGGIGISMGDLETMVRYKLPAVVVLLNNSSWGGAALAHDVYHPDLGSWDMLPGIRYDKMFEALGCHTEFVEDSKDLRPALERSFSSGKPALVNVISDSDATALPWAYIKFGDAWAKQGARRLPEKMAEQFRNQSPHVVKRMMKFWRDNGLEIPLEDAAALTGKTVEELSDASARSPGRHEKVSG